MKKVFRKNPEGLVKSKLPWEIFGRKWKKIIPTRKKKHNISVNKSTLSFQLLLTLSFEFLNCFIWGIMFPTPQHNLLFPQSSFSKYCDWTFFIKIYWIFALQIVPDYSQFWNPLETFKSCNFLNQIKIFWNFVLVKSVCQYLKKLPFLVLLQMGYLLNAY